MLHTNLFPTPVREGLTLSSACSEPSAGPRARVQYSKYCSKVVGLSGFRDILRESYREAGPLDGERPAVRNLSAAALQDIAANGKTKDTGRGNKVKFMRVIMALYKANYFELPGGGDVGVETVFKAFGDMVGEDYSDYAEHLYSAGNHNINNPDKTLQVFEELKRGFKKYLDEKPEE